MLFFLSFSFFYISCPSCCVLFGWNCFCACALYSPGVKCACALICVTQTFTLQPVFSSDNYMFSCKVCPILQQHLSRRQEASVAVTAGAAALPAVFKSQSKWHWSFGSIPLGPGQSLPYVSASLHVYTCPYPDCVFSSPRFQFHSQHSRLVEPFGSFWSTFQHWMPRPWCTLKELREGAETPWRHDAGEPCWTFVAWKKDESFLWMFLFFFN